MNRRSTRTADNGHRGRLGCENYRPKLKRGDRLIRYIKTYYKHLKRRSIVRQRQRITRELQYPYSSKSNRECSNRRAFLFFWIEDAQKIYMRTVTMVSKTLIGFGKRISALTRWNVEILDRVSRSHVKQGFKVYTGHGIGDCDDDSALRAHLSYKQGSLSPVYLQ